VTQGIIDRSAYSLYLNDAEAFTGSILFGGVDSTKYTGDLVALPLQPVNDTVSAFYVALTDISINDNTGTTSLTGSNFAGVSALLDSGTTGQQLPTDAANALFQGLGASQGLVACNVRNTNATLTYQFGGTGGPAVTVPISEIIAPWDGNTTFENGDAACDLGASAESGNGIILGDVVLRSAYVVYDVENDQVAIAEAALNATSTSNILAIPAGTSIPGVSSTATLMLPTDIANQAQTGSLAPAAASGTASASESAAGPATPTFNLGPSATAAESAAGSGNVSGSSGSGNPSTGAGHFVSVDSGVVTMICLAAGFVSLFGAVLL